MGEIKSSYVLLEKCMADLLQRSSLTTYKGVHQTLVIDRRFRFPMKSSLFLTTCSNNVVYLTHAGVLPWRFRVHFEKKKTTRRQSRKVEEEYNFEFCCFFSFSACSKADGWCTSTWCRTGARSTWPSKAQSISADRPLPMRAPSAFEKRQRRP